MHGSKRLGMRYRLQGYRPELSNAAVNAFDIETWQQASRLDRIMIELLVYSGEVKAKLCKIGRDGAMVNYGRLDCSGPGAARIAPISVKRDDGLVLPIVEHTSEDADFDIYFGTNEHAPNPHAKIAFVVSGDAEQCYAARTAFVTFLTEQEREGAATTAHLILFNDYDTEDVPANSQITKMPADKTGGAGNMGRGLYDICYGRLAMEGFTHACLVEAADSVHPEMYARTLAFARFQRPWTQLKAPAYAAADKEHPGRPCLGAGTQWSIGATADIDGRVGIAPDDYSALQALDRQGDLSDWHWYCIGLREVHAFGFPYPFIGPNAATEYSARMRDSGVTLLTPLSFWKTQQTDRGPNIRLRDYWTAMLAKEGTEGTKRLRKELEDALGHASDNHLSHQSINDAEAVLKGPYNVLRETRAESGAPLRTGAEAPERWLGCMRRWQRSVSRWRDLLPNKWRQKRVLSRLAKAPHLASRFRTARDELCTSVYWSQMAANDAPADHLFFWPFVVGNVRRLAHERSAAHLQMAALEDRQLNMWQTLEQRPRNERVHGMSGLRADLDRANRTALTLLRGRHSGQRAVIVGNGPSLRVSDLERFGHDVSFASNKIYLAFSDTDWRPTYYSVEDHLVMLNNFDEISRLEGTIKVFPAQMQDSGFGAADTIFVPLLEPLSFEDPLSDPAFPDFSTDLSRGICWGSTIVYSQIQMAAFMGCNPIVLVGVDHDYQLPSVRKGDFYLQGGERNHFHPDYRAPGERWHRPNLEVLEVSYARAREACESRGITILNASRKTRLKVFERAKFDDLFAAN